MTKADGFGLIWLSELQMQHPELLTGLESWLQLGLLSQAQVSEFCQRYLVCSLAEQPAAELDIAPDLSLDDPSTDDLPTNTIPTPSDDFADALADALTVRQPARRPARQPARQPVRLRAKQSEQPAGSSTAQTPSRFALVMQSFMAEIGVIWLLCLGVFMVVVSSGVLAASQWQNFSPVGQYGILLTYTLAFWGASLWTARRVALRLTARMLQMATLLLVPVNFWMMDGLKLWQQGLGIGLNLLAAGVLTAVTYSLLPSLVPVRPASKQSTKLCILNLLGLSWLHWGWAVAGVPVLVTYVGTVGTAILIYRQSQRSVPEAAPESTPEATPDLAQPVSLPMLLIGLATLLLLGRAIWAAQVPLSRLGLAFGICGWLFCWLTRRDMSSLTPSLTPSSAPSLVSWATNLWAANLWAANLWTKVGIGLLLLGWGVSVAVSPPLQAVAVSGLGLWLLGERLVNQPQTESRTEPRPAFRTGDIATQTGLLLLGLQTYGLLWRLLPADWRQTVLNLAAQQFGEAGMPLVLLGLAGFPYLWLMLGWANWQRQHQTSKRAQLTETMALGLGGLLILIGWFNPPVRAITLSLSAITLAATLRPRILAASLKQGWLYLNHCLILAAVAAWIGVGFSDLSPLVWARLLLVGMAIEWGLSIEWGRGRGRWRQTCWYLGLGLAGLSYALLLSYVLPLNRSIVTAPLHPNLIWLVTPALLTGLTRVRQFSQSQTAAWLSSAGLLAQIGLLIWALNLLPSWILLYAVATGLMWVNMLALEQQLRPPAALLTVGFGLGFAATVLNYSTDLRLGGALIWLAVALWILWLLQAGLCRWGGDLNQLYAEAADRWAVGLTGLGLVILTAYCWLAAGLSQAGQPSQFALSSVLMASALAYRCQGRKLFYMLAWAVELVVITLGLWQESSTEMLAVATLGLGLVTQLAGDWWVSQPRLSQSRQSETSWQTSWQTSWHIIPVGYAGLGWLFGHAGLGLTAALTATTGLYSLAAALIGVGVGRRLPQFKPLTLMALLLASFGAYELLVYQLMQATGGSVGDGLILLAGLAALIAAIERLGKVWLLPYLRLTQNELAQVAHLHWGLGTGLSFAAIPLSLSNRGFGLWLCVVSGLTVYALAQGRQLIESQAASPAPSPASKCWTYIGILEALAVVSYVLYRLVPTSWLLGWAGTIAAGVAIGLYFLPWRNWGWPTDPGRNLALLLPGTVVLFTMAPITIQSLLIVAAFYAAMAKTEHRPRLSYWGVALLDWALGRYLLGQGLLNLTWLSAILAGSLLYIAQIDPALQLASAKEQRHWLRSFAVGLLSLTLLYQAELETGTMAVLVNGLTLVGSVGLMFLGLGLRTRAFLYVGTATFVLKILRLLWLFIDNYSLLLWAIGIVIGLAFIWIAATFEARRSQVNALMQYWLTEFENWD